MGVTFSKILRVRVKILREGFAHAGFTILDPN